MKKKIKSGFINKTGYKVGLLYLLLNGAVAELLRINQVSNNMEARDIHKKYKTYHISTSDIVKEVTKETNPEYWL